MSALASDIRKRLSTRVFVCSIVDGTRLRAMARTMFDRLVSCLSPTLVALQCVLDVAMIALMIDLAKNNSYRYLYCAIFTVPYNLAQLMQKLSNALPQNGGHGRVYSEIIHLDGYIYKAAMHWVGRSNMGEVVKEFVRNYLGSIELRSTKF